MVHVLERFTDTARRVVVHAQEEAHALEHGHIGTEHLLLGLLRGDTDGAVRALDAAGLTLDTARGDVEELVGRGTAPPDTEVPFTPRAKKVLELSLREALQSGHDYIRSEHILLGLMRETEGTGARILRRCGVDTLELRRDVMTFLRGPEPLPDEPSTEPPVRPAGEEGPWAVSPAGEGPRSAAERLTGEGPRSAAERLTGQGPRSAAGHATGEGARSAGPQPPETAIERRLSAIEHRLERIERLLRDGPGPGSA
ncbi:Clp protease N-terminal domain-containing protein [Actinoallomurus rhizosphaericola]|uniref:Clp protease N-terminal domain-containing protein n=1 Tax=Actinoallomurus rhizosphaericola TaxID=2952536 RepID=UPI0027E25210|nr:Clp protease N-terminal domain-containing protein [Actinoallomurus rhizosphaericola]